MNIPTREKLIKDIDKFCKEHKIKAHSFGRSVLRDSGAVSRLKKGSNPRLSTIQRIYKYINAKSKRKIQGPSKRS